MEQHHNDVADKWLDTISGYDACTTNTLVGYVDGMLLMCSPFI